MRIFNGISSHDGYETIQTAVDAIADYAQSLMTSEWSLAELQLDNEDFAWLCEWASNLQSGVASRCLTDGQWRKFIDGKYEFSYTIGLGTLLLLSAVEIARRNATERSLWAAISREYFSETTKTVLFVQGYPTHAYKDAIELAARWLKLRHVFGKEGLQNWYDTLYLQFGWTKQGILHRLPEWLVGQSQTLAMQQLLNGPMYSATFQDLWDDLLHFRRKNITEGLLRTKLKQSVWVLPEWTDDLVRQAQTRLNLGYGGDTRSAKPTVDGEMVSELFLATPVLHWDPSDTPRFTCYLNNLANLDLVERNYDIIIAERICSRLQQRVNGSYKAVPSAEITLPVTSPLIVANLVAPDGLVVQSQVLQLWDEGEDVTAFLATSGQRFDPWQRVMRTETEYILLLGPDLAIEPRPDLWHKWGQSTLYFLTRGWSPKTQVWVDQNILWQPYFMSSAIVPECVLKNTIQIQLYNPPPLLHFGDAVRFSITYPENTTVIFVRCVGQPIGLEQVMPGQEITEPVVMKPDLFSHATNASIELILGIKNGTNTITTCVRQLVDVHITGTAILKPEGWTILQPTFALNLELARTRPIKIFLMGIEQWGLLEGDIWLGPLWTHPKPLKSNIGIGLGAPLMIQKSRYNASAFEPPRQLIQEVIDRGCLAKITVDAIDTPMRLLSLKLSRSIEPDEQHKIVWWDKDGSFHLFAPEIYDIQEQRMYWFSSVPQNLTQPIAIAIAYNGVRLGAWWRDDWSNSIRSASIHASHTTAAMLRWFHLPLLSPRFVDDVRQFAVAYPAEVLAAWVGDQGQLPMLQFSERDDGWLSAVRVVFQQWQPNNSLIEEIITRLSNPQNDDLWPDQILQQVVWRLLRVSPLLMGKVLQQWIETVGIPQWGRRQVHALLSKLSSDLVDSAPGNKKELLVDDIATAMGIDPLFVEKALIQPACFLFNGQQISPTDQGNLAVATNDMLFRLLLGKKLFTLIDG